MPSVWHERRGRNYIVCWYVFDKRAKRSRVVGASMQDVADYKAKKLREVRREHLGLPPLPADEAADQITVSSYLERYLKDRKAERAVSTVEHFDKPAAAAMTTFVGSRFLSSLTTKDAHDFKVWLLTKAPRRGGYGYHPNTARMWLLASKAAFSHAEKVGQIKANPFKGLPMPPIVQVGRVPSDEEVANILNVAAPLLRCLIYFLVHQGCRRGDAAALDWSRLEVLSTGRWRFTIPGAQTKNRRDKVLLLHREVQRLLIAMGPKASGPVFPMSKTWVDTHWDSAKQLAGIKTRLRLHDLKVKFVNGALDRGLSETTIMDATGNLSRSSLGHYIKQGQLIRADQIDQISYEIPAPQMQEPLGMDPNHIVYLPHHAPWGNFQLQRIRATSTTQGS